MSEKSAVSVFKPPPNPDSLIKRKASRKVLEENEYVESISRIIEEDFFPGLPEIRRLESEDDEPSENEPLLEKNGIRSSLDSFLATHTGEDNESFNEIMEKGRKEEALKKDWIFKDSRLAELESSQKSIENLRVPSIEEQVSFSSSKERIPLQGWKYKATNTVFYPVEGVALTREQEIERAKKERKIVHENTRFSANPWKQNDVLIVKRKDPSHNGKVGIDGKELERGDNTPSINGYKIMRMTSPAVDPSESPLMTWGDIDSTPQRIDGGPQTPYIGGRQFTIQKVPERDQIALELAEKNAKFYRDKKQKAIQKARKNIRTPSSSERLASMSPAAQRLATSKLGIRLGTDKRTPSATPSPLIKGHSGSTTPLKNVISSSIRAKSSTPDTRCLTDGLLKIGSSKKGESTEDESLTDDLLNISSNQRKKASDFF